MTALEIARAIDIAIFISLALGAGVALRRLADDWCRHRDQIRRSRRDGR